MAYDIIQRKCRNGDEALAEEIWNRPAARRRSAILPDELDPPRPYNARGPGSPRPYNAKGPGSPRPPTMIERHLNNAPSMPSRQYPNNVYGPGYGAMQYHQPSFSPGDVVSPTSADPFISPYAQDVMTSPVLRLLLDNHRMVWAKPQWFVGTQSPVDLRVQWPVRTQSPADLKVQSSHLRTLPILTMSILCVLV